MTDEGSGRCETRDQAGGNERRRIHDDERGDASNGAPRVTTEVLGGSNARVIVRLAEL